MNFTLYVPNFTASYFENGVTKWFSVCFSKVQLYAKFKYDVNLSFPYWNFHNLSQFQRDDIYLNLFYLDKLKENVISNRTTIFAFFLLQFDDKNVFRFLYLLGGVGVGKNYFLITKVQWTSFNVRYDIPLYWNPINFKPEHKTLSRFKTFDWLDLIIVLQSILQESEWLI